MYKIERNIQPIFYSNHDSSACHDEIGIKNREREGIFFARAEIFRCVTGRAAVEGVGSEKKQN